MITVPPKKLLMIVPLIAGTTIILALAFHLNQAERQNKQLKRTLELLQASFDAEREIYQRQRDSIQLLIVAQQEVQVELKQQISSLEKSKEAINKSYHEQKHAVLRLRAVDSLYHEVARHYRP